MDVKIKLIIFCTIHIIIFYEAEARFLKLQEHERLIKCSKCPPGWGVISKCNTAKDTRCKKCEYGKSYSPYYSSKSSCWLCSQCGIGLYEAHKCSPFRDTKCNECTAFIGRKNFTKKNDFDKKCSYMFVEHY